MFSGRQPRARGGVLICGTETGTVHDSWDFLTSRLDTLWCPSSFCVCSQCFVIEFSDRFHGSSDTIIRVSYISLSVSLSFCSSSRPSFSLFFIMRVSVCVSVVLCHSFSVFFFFFFIFVVQTLLCCTRPFLFCFLLVRSSLLR